MALPAAILCLLISLLVAVTPLPAASSEEPARTGSLIQCYDPAPALSNTTNGTESFRATLLPLLAGLPSVAAPTGFASLNSSGSAFVRGLCFGNATVPSESDCHACLSVAAKNLTAGCGATTRRAGIWTDGCFVAFADSNDSSNAEYAFRERVVLRGSGCDAQSYYSYYLHAWLVDDKARPLALSAAANVSGPRMLATADATGTAGCSVRSSVHVLAQCARDRTAAECTSCLQASARLVDWDVDADRRDGGVAAAVVGFNCYLRFEVATTSLRIGWLSFIIGGLFVVLVLAFVICCICYKK